MDTLIIVKDGLNILNHLLWLASTYEKYLRNLCGKTCVKLSLKIDRTKNLITNGSLMKVKSIAECPMEHSAILLTCVKR